LPAKNTCLNELEEPRTTRSRRRSIRLEAVGEAPLGLDASGLATLAGLDHTMASGDDRDEMKEPEWMVKKREYEQRMARVKNAKLRTLCTICSAKAKLPCPCGTAQYCTVACQRIDWRDRGHRAACKKIRDDRAAEAARAEAPPSPPKEVVYGPAPRSHADEVRARIAAEHEAARALREANPEREPASARYGSRCPICLEEWDVNATGMLRGCCCRKVCRSCQEKIKIETACPLCRIPCAKTHAETLAHLRRHVENEVPEAITCLGSAYRFGHLGLMKSDKKAAKIYRRAVELGDVEAMRLLGEMCKDGSGVKLDKKKAERLFRMAADQGDAIAQCNLGILLDSEKQREEAFRYYALAADQGLTPGEINLGICYRNGRGTEVDLDKAKYWYGRAAAKGAEPAIEELAHLDAQV
jgi:TPR repeat protein